MAKVEGKVTLSIPGLSASLQGDQPSGLRALWMLMVIVCAAVCGKLVLDRVGHFFTYPVVLTYEMVDDVHSSFPKITFCPRLRRDLDEDPGCEGNLTYLNLWDEDRLWEEPFYNIISFCSTSEGLNCKDHGYWSKHMSSLGVAYTLDITNRSNIDTWYVYLATKSDQIKKWKILLHEDVGNIVYDCMTSVMSVKNDKWSSYIFSKSKRVFEDVPPRPCQSRVTHQKCIHNCLDQKLLNGANCRLPFMTSVGDSPMCDSCATIRHIYRSFDWRNLQNVILTCNCTRPCTEVRFEIDIDTRERVPTSLAVFLARDEVEYLREKRSYTLLVLICEIGGIIGLYLGACLLTFIEIVQILSGAVHRQITKPHGQPFYPGWVRNIN